ncbi:MAG: signal recognition particle-docking protein FtsY [Candidatus Aenigmarchaeota archaeon]|nr:signal recognition particle-docking protein FtsY [Candidatus Aenigmarchaeota archaeon]
MFGFIKKSLKEIVKKFEKPKEDKKEVEKKTITKPKKTEDKVKKEPAKKESKPIEDKEVKSKDEIKEIEKPKKRGFFSKQISEKDLEKFKLELVKANVSFDVAEEIAEKLRDKDGRNIKKLLRTELLSLLKQEEFKIENFIKEKIKEQGNCLVLFFGYNGSGKTTTIARLGYLLKEQKIPVVFAAADTFRAAAIEQLSAHADNLKIDIVKHKYGGDPAAVVFDAKKHAEAINGVVLADTAGRLHSDKNLMEELHKILRINKPDTTILVLDSLTGSDILEQIEKFGEVDFDALILTKVDVNEKGGAMLSVKQKTDKPILFLGMGQEYKDLEKFDAEKIVKKMLD